MRTINFATILFVSVIAVAASTHDHHGEVARGKEVWESSTNPFVEDEHAQSMPQTGAQLLENTDGGFSQDISSQKDLQRLEHRAKSKSRSGAKAKVKANAAATSSQVKYTGAYGGNGGGVVKSFCKSGNYINHWKVRSGSLVDQIQGRCNDGTWLQSCGGNGGGLSEGWPAWGIQKMQTRTGSLVDKFNNRGGNGGAEHWMDCGEGYRITGYIMRCGRLVDKVQLQCTEINAPGHDNHHRHHPHHHHRHHPHHHHHHHHHHHRPHTHTVSTKRGKGGSSIKNLAPCSEKDNNPHKHNLPPISSGCVKNCVDEARKHAKYTFYSGDCTPPPAGYGPDSAQCAQCCQKQCAPKEITSSPRRRSWSGKGEAAEEEDSLLALLADNSHNQANEEIDLSAGWNCG